MSFKVGNLVRCVCEVCLQKKDRTLYRIERMDPKNFYITCSYLKKRVQQEMKLYWRSFRGTDLILYNGWDDI